MQYDPIKTVLGKFFNRTPRRRKVFYALLDLLLLRAWHIHKALKTIAAENPEIKMVLDAGAGFGQYAYYMFRKFKSWQIHGVDINPDQIGDVQQFFANLGASDRTSFGVANLEEFKDPDVFDLILCVDVMEHIPDDNRVFRNFFDSLKPGGTLLISTPSDQGGSDVHDEEDSSFIEEHVRDGYNLMEIQKQLKQAGFTKTQARYSYGKPGHISWLISMKYPIILINRSKWFFLLLPVYYLIFYPVAFVLNVLDVHLQHRTGTGLIVMAGK